MRVTACLSVPLLNQELCLELGWIEPGWIDSKLGFFSSLVSPPCSVSLSWAFLESRARFIPGWLGWHAGLVWG